MAIPEDRLDAQFGFTSGRAPVHATLILNEAIAEAKDKKQPLYIANLDIQKEFYVVPHKLLLRELYHGGLPGIWWMLKKERYDGMSMQVIRCGNKGDPFDLPQGIIQGGIGGTSHFKVALHDSIEPVIGSDIGFHIGSTYIEALADDVVLIATSKLEHQQQLMLFNYFTNRERFKIHPTKTCVSIFNPTQYEYNFYSKVKPWKISNIPTSI